MASLKTSFGFALTTARHPHNSQYGQLLTIPGFRGHVAGSYENEKGNIVVDLTIASDHVFSIFPPDSQANTPTTLL
jgi:hypothetical protein